MFKFELKNQKKPKQTKEEKRLTMGLEFSLKNLALAIQNNEVESALNILRNDGDAIFYFAACNNKLKEVNLILTFCDTLPEKNYHLTANSFSEDGSCLAEAIAAHHFDLAEVLIPAIIKKKEAVNPPDRYGATPLHFACIQGNLSLVSKIVEELLRQNQEINPSTEAGITPQHYAASNGHVHILRYLNQYIPNPNPLLPNTTGAHLIQLGFENYPIFKEIIKALESKKLNTNPPIKHETIMHIMATVKDIRFIKLLVNTLIRQKQDFNPPCPSDTTRPLDIAIITNNMPTVVFLLDKLEAHKIAINYKDYFVGSAQGNRFDIALLFLKRIPLNQQQNFVTPCGKTVLQLAIDADHTLFIQTLLPPLIEQWKSYHFFNENRLSYWDDISQSLVFIKQIEQLFELLKTIASEEVEEACLIVLNHAEHYHSRSLAKQIVFYLKEYEGLEKTWAFLKRSADSKKPSSYLFQIVASLRKEIDNNTAEFNKKISLLNALLPSIYYCEAMLGNEGNFQQLKISYNNLNALIGFYSIDLKNSPKEDLENKLPKMLETLEILKTEHDIQEARFLSEETRLKNKFRATLDPFVQDLIFFKEKIKFSLDQTLSSALLEEDQRLAFLEQQTLLNQVLIQCDLEIEKSKSMLSPTLHSTFDLARKQVRSVQLQLIVFHAEEDNKRAKAALITAKIEAQRQHEKVLIQLDSLCKSNLNKIQKICTFLKEAPERNKFQIEWQEILFSLQAYQTELESPYLSLIDKTNDNHQETAKNVLARFNNIHDNLKQIHARIKMHLEQARIEENRDQRQALIETVLKKINEAKKNLSRIIEHPICKQVLGNPQNALYADCIRYKSMYETLESSHMDGTPEKLNQAIEFYNNYLQRLDRLEINIATEIFDLEDKLNLFAQTSLHHPGLKALHCVTQPVFPSLIFSPTVSSTPLKRKKGGRKPLPLSAENLQLAASCEAETKDLQEILQRLPASRETLEAKSNALLLAIAMLFEGMREMYGPHPLKSGHPQSLDVALTIRNAIFHFFQKEEITQAQYLRLYDFANTLQTLVQNNMSFEEVLSTFFDIMPLQSHLPLVCAGRIYHHIARLKWYITAIENGKIDLSENIIARYNITFLVGQFNGLLSDLKSNNQVNPDRTISRAISRIHKEILTELHMQVFTSRLSGNDARHGGPQAVLRVADKFLLSAVTRISELSEQKNCEIASPQALEAEFSALNLNGPHSRRKKIK